MELEIYVLTRDYHYKDFSNAENHYFNNIEEVNKYIKVRDIIKINDNLYYSRSNPYFYTLDTLHNSNKIIMETKDIKKALEILHTQRNNNIDLVLKIKKGGKTKCLKNTIIS